MPDVRRVIQRHAMRDATAAIMTHHREAVEAERSHDLDLVSGHDALGVVGMIGQAMRFAAVAIAAQIGGHHGEAFSEPVRDLVPDDMRLRKPVQE